jgi:hypothetical protein
VQVVQLVKLHLIKLGILSTRTSRTSRSTGENAPIIDNWELHREQEKWQITCAYKTKLRTQKKTKRTYAMYTSFYKRVQASDTF